MAEKWAKERELEGRKFDHRREGFYEYMEFLKRGGMRSDVGEFMEHFPAYVGHMALNRVLTIYELYKMSLGLAGHIADVGVYRGASSLLFAKLIKIFESESLTLCHGFDWFEGTGEASEKDTDIVPEGSYKADYEELMMLIKKQQMDNILKIHKLNLITDLGEFFKAHNHLRFKLVMMDAGMYDVMKAAIPFFWERLNPGGIMIFDQYSTEFGPGETAALHELLPDVVIRTVPHSWMPNAYVIKPGK